MAGGGGGVYFFLWGGVFFFFPPKKKRCFFCFFFFFFLWVFFFLGGGFLLLCVQAFACHHIHKKRTIITGIFLRENYHKMTAIIKLIYHSPAKRFHFFRVRFYFESLKISKAQSLQNSAIIDRTLKYIQNLHH